MKEITPKVYLIGYTVVDFEGISQYLLDIKQSDWESNADTESDQLIEVAGRICYRSWAPFDGTEGTNPNITKVREDNKEYIQNIIKQSHGSVLEHSNVSLLFRDVSRVFTHEMVRHRAGMAYSQESLRYVRLDKLRFFIPEEIKQDPELYQLYQKTVEHLEAVQETLSHKIKSGSTFHDKKVWTSRFRRLAPLGLATTILATGNLRAWRHIVNMRSSAGAEEEIRMVMDQVVPILKHISPSVFDDLNKIDGVWKYELNAKP